MAEYIAIKGERALEFLNVGEGGMEPQRRQVTVLFPDMVGFTSFSERPGEEAAHTRRHL